MLTYKAEWCDVKIQKIDQFQASTTICHKCGYKLDHALDVKYRTWTCPGCKTELDRDFNAAKVIDMVAENILPKYI